MLTSCTAGPGSAPLPLQRKPLGPLDLDALQRLLQICSMDVMMIDADHPRATLGSLRQNAGVGCTVEHDFALRSRFTVPADHLLLGFVHRAGANSWSRASALATGSALSIAAGVEADLMFGAGSRVTLLLLRTAASRNPYLELLLDGDAPQRIFQPGSSERPSTLEKTYQQLRWKILLHSDPAYASLAEPIDLERVLEGHAIACLRAGEDQAGLPSRYRHYLVVQQVEKYLRANLTRDIYLKQMCRVAKVSERTLRYAFSDLLGISPLRFLTMLRLCVASRTLSQADARRRSVKSIAMDCGLRDLSRFADSYRRVFGELPHETLLRSSAGPALSAKARSAP